MTKYIFVTGGVVSGLGKGITAASLGRLLKERGYKVTIQKFDPYLNVDPRHMSPYQHGEIFITDDGAETDLDIGHYERFIDENLSVNSNVTCGKIYWSVINKERRGEFGGKTVQVIPHITNEIKGRLKRAASLSEVDVVITEIGGTVGDIESLPLIEAVRQLSVDVGRENSMFVHVTLVPYIAVSNELKTKPTQHSVKELLSLGISPDVLVCRTEFPLNKELKEKISLFCNVRPRDVINNLTAETLYEVPLMLEEEGLADVTCEHLKIKNHKTDLSKWEQMVKKIKNLSKKTKVAIVGKYVEMPDAYLSISEALNHGGLANDSSVDISFVSSELFEKEDPAKTLSQYDGIIIAPGFGERGTEGKINAIKFARESGLPVFGICLGMQLMTVEFGRNVLGLSSCNSSEFSPEAKHPVVSLIPARGDGEATGMRLGLHPTKISDGSKAHDIYGESLIYERHRHKYEFNNLYKSQYEAAGLKFSGSSPDSNLAEICELPAHPWFIGVQFHPEYISRPNRPHPLFVDFIKACLNKKK